MRVQTIAHDTSPVLRKSVPKERDTPFDMAQKVTERLHGIFLAHRTSFERAQRADLFHMRVGCENPGRGDVPP